MQLNGKIALVTGGSAGIGKAIVNAFIMEGAKVIIFDIQKPDFEVPFYKVDISKENEIRDAFKSINALDILVNNAGVYSQGSLEDINKSDLDNMIDINLKGTCLITKYGIPLLKKSKGNIINISSGLGIVPEPESPVYCATKSALIMLTKCLAQEYANEGLRVNSILPGPIDTPLLRSAFQKESDLDLYRKLNPMKEIGKPSDVANVAVFLASDKARYVTGGMYSVDGGESASSLYSK